MTRFVDTAQFYRRLAETLEELRGDVARSLTDDVVQTWLVREDEVDALHTDDPASDSRGGHPWADDPVDL
jgi:hypothetical protein